MKRGTMFIRTHTRFNDKMIETTLNTQQIAYMRADDTNADATVIHFTDSKVVVANENIEALTHKIIECRKK